MNARAIAHPNIALVKYWGKRDGRLNLPARGSISMTLAGFWARTEVEWREDLAEDRLDLDGRVEEGVGLARAARVLDAVRAVTGERRRARISSRTNFPTASGLASSSAGFAALALAASASTGWQASERELSILARLGSGSACRSIAGGFAEWVPGTGPEGDDSFAVSIAPPDWWEVRMLVAKTTAGRKSVPSGEGMERTARTSPYYEAFLDSIEGDLARVREGIAGRDLARVGETMERSALRMHAAMLGCDPPLIYWSSATIALIHAVGEVRRGGTEAYFTVDAGPHVKVLCRAGDAGAVRSILAEVPGVVGVDVCATGGAAAIEAEPPGSSGRG